MPALDGLRILDMTQYEALWAIFFEHVLRRVHRFEDTMKMMLSYTAPRNCKEFAIMSGQFLTSSCWAANM